MTGPSDTDLNTTERTTILKATHKNQISDEVHFFLISTSIEIETKRWKLNNTAPIIIIFPSDQPIQIKGKYLTLSLLEDDFLSLLLNPLYLKAPGKSVQISTRGRCKEQFYQINNEDSLNCLRSIFHRAMQEDSTAIDLLDKEMAYLSLLIKMKKLPALRESELSSNSLDKKHDIWSIVDLAEHLRNHYDNPLSLDEMASRCALNASYLSRSFKKKTGTTIFAYLNRVRIEKACHLLKSSSMTITEIAFSVGYNNISFFNRMFKRAMSLSPGEYRRKIKF